MQVNVSITGGPELIRALQDLGPVPARDLGIQALSDGAELIAEEARAHAPVSDVPEKHLRDSIVVVPRSSSNAFCHVQIGFTEPAARHAGFVEFGTSKMSAEPFMRPALDSQGLAAINQIMYDIRVGIEMHAAGAMGQGIDKSTSSIPGVGLILGAVEDVAVIAESVL